MMHSLWSPSLISWPVMMKGVEKLMNKLGSFIVSPLRKRVQRTTLVSGVMPLFLLVVFLSACSIPLVNQTTLTSYQFKFAPAQSAKEILGYCQASPGRWQEEMHGEAIADTPFFPTRRCRVAVALCALTMWNPSRVRSIPQSTRPFVCCVCWRGLL